MARTVTRQPQSSPPDGGGDPAYLTTDTRRRDPQTTHRAPPFILAAKPGAWEVSSGMIVPRLSRYAVRSGLNGTGPLLQRVGGSVREVGDDPSLLRANLASWGKIEIPHAVDGPGTSYMRRPAPGCHVDRWTTVYAGTDRVTVDKRGYDEWRASLVSRGLIPQPLRPDLDALRARYARQRDDLARKTMGLKESIDGAELERITDAIRVIDEAIAKMSSEPGKPLPGGDAVSV